MRRLGALGASIPFLLVPGIAPPAQAAAPATLPIARALLGELRITVPASADLGTGMPGATTSRQLGTVTVSDSRIVAIVNDWTATVTSTAFRQGTGAAAPTIPTTQIAYWSGQATQKTGLGTGPGTLHPGQATSADAYDLSVARIAYRKSAGIGTNQVSWQPTLVVTIPANAVGGLYTATVTHSVS